VPHIYAKSEGDLFFAQGFVAAQDRLYQIDMWRRVAVGETAEVLGPEAVVRDRFARLVKYRGPLREEWASYGPDTRRIVGAFTRGVNAYIDYVGDRLPIEFQLLGYRPGKWEPEDCMGRTSVLAVAFNLRREIARAEMVASVGAEKTRELMPGDPDVPYGPAPGLDLSGIDRSLLAGYEAVVAPVRFGAREEASNNWAVDGSLSASGKPMLASDPHRSIGLPSLRYLVHLNAPGWNVIGSGEPALPGVAIGHNERIAWGFTVVLTDQADLIVEETNPADPNQYKVDDRWETMEILRETVPVRGAKPVSVELRFTRNGPVLHEDRGRHRAYALRWMGSEPGTAAYLSSLAVDRAGNWEEFLQAVEGWKAPSENLVYADVDGNIGWVAAALTPVRKGWHGLLPVPGADGAYRWQGFLNVEDLPQAYNPADHVLATSNHNILPAGYPHEISFDWVPDYRYRRVRERLAEKEKLTLDDFKSIQHDNVSIPGRQLARLLSEVEVSDPKLERFVTLMTAWDGALTKDSPAAPLYAIWLGELKRGFFGPKTPKHLIKAAADRNGIAEMLGQLTDPTEAWFGDGAARKRDQLVRATFARAVRKTQEALGDDPSGWAWGRLHHVLFEHPLAELGPAYAEAFNIGPVPSGSGPYTPDQARYDEGFSRLHGATYREVFDLADWDKGMATSAPGQSGQPGSPHYDDLLPLWENAEYFPLAFTRKKVEAVTRRRLVLKPAE
ncbi:MAG: penicillin acylase family protein, partial [Planctomycetes bacterium]|nr:penicillin acylase family protein [Planctomycetota bacterium]